MEPLVVTLRVLHRVRNEVKLSDRVIVRERLHKFPEHVSEVHVEALPIVRRRVPPVQSLNPPAKEVAIMPELALQESGSPRVRALSAQNDGRSWILR